MPFAPDDIGVGMLAYYTVNHLRRDGRIRTNNPTRCSKPRPFLCYAEDGQELYWTCLTRTIKPRRKVIDVTWLRVPRCKYKGFEQVIICDARNSWVGPAEAFAERSEKYDDFRGMMRPFLFGMGLEEAISTIAHRGGWMPPAAPVPMPARRAA